MLYNIVKNEVLKNFRKEYFCHLIYVEKIALTLQKRLGGNIKVIRISSIGHDIGRVEGGNNKLHAEKGSGIILSLLLKNGCTKDKALLVSKCTLMHNKTSNFLSIEEEIVSNADALSKLIYHEMFMLMCKKEDYISKAKWGLKYIEKSYNHLSIKFLKEEYKDLYIDLRQKYKIVIGNN